jgi:hypothetical protein
MKEKCYFRASKYETQAHATSHTHTYIYIYIYIYIYLGERRGMKEKGEEREGAEGGRRRRRGGGAQSRFTYVSRKYHTQVRYGICR